MQINNQGAALPKSVDIRSFNRPVKVAFLVPIEENQISHWILDGIFSEAYSRWGGTHSLLIPFDNGQPESGEYLKWLATLDPDFIYSFVDLEEYIISKINQLTIPIEMIRHQIYGDPERWQQYIPKWPYDFEPIQSISTLTSPQSNFSHWFESPTPQTYITQHFENDKSRFIPDNFGSSPSTSGITYGQVGTFETICYCDDNTPDNHNVGTYRCSNINEILEKLTSKQLRTFSRLAHIHSEGIYHPSNYLWSNAFHIFIGDSVRDRLHCWNSRLLTDINTVHDFSSLYIPSLLLEDDQFFHHLGQFLNKFNFKGGNQGPYKTNIRSLSLNSEQCQKIADKLQPLTWTSVHVTDNFSTSSLPSADSYRHHYSNLGVDCPSFKIRESQHTYIAQEPEHFQYLTANLLHLKKGQWLIELLIERHQDDSDISNIFNDWKLPHRFEIVRAFTNNMGRVSSASNLVLIPKKTQESPFNNNVNQDKQVHLSLPDDDVIFKFLIVDMHSSEFNDMRKCLNRDNKYKNIKISDKGQNHRGIVALFNNNVNDASILTNIFWRNVIRDSLDEHKPYSMDNFISYINDLTKKSLKDFMKQMRFTDIGVARNFLRENIKDVIEYLVHNEVLLQVHSWRCSFCGSKNKRSLDTLKLENTCDICKSYYQTPIDMTWEFIMSPFVVNSLAKHNGLTVLWGISNLIERSFSRQSIYLPEVDLFHEYNNKNLKNEIDLIALIDGKYIVAEVKLSAASFITKRDEIDAFVDEIIRLYPDIAYLIFEQYCDEDDEKEWFKDRLDELIIELRQRIPDTTNLKVIVSSEYPEFVKIPFEFGPYGKRTWKMLDKLENCV